jgi:hypothetical protein
VDEVFSRIVSSTLEEVLGVSIKTVFFLDLKNDFGVSEDKVAENPDALVAELDKLLGSSGRKFLETRISKELLRELNLPSQLGGRTMTEILNDARQRQQS